MKRESLPIGERLLAAITVLVAALVVLAIVGVVRDGGPAVVGADAQSADTFVAHLETNEFGIDGDLTVPAGPVAFEIHNGGAIVHNIVIRDGTIRSPDLAADENFRLELGEVGVGTFEILCDVPGHEAAGMVATVTVVPADTNVESGAVHDDEEPDWEALDQAMTESILEFPAATEGLGNQPLVPTIASDGALEFELVAAITPWEVEPGRFVDAWTYNGQVPGPAIRVDVGDRVRVTVRNELPMSTDVHWHGVDTPNAMDGVAPLTQELIGPGDTFVYEFVAEEPAIGMYHAHHHAQLQVPNGLFATFIVGDMPIPYGETISGIDIPADLEISQEIPMVLNDAGVIGLSLNGKSFPATQPYVATEGDWVVINYYNEGLQIHPMHMHQFPQLIFAKDGIPLDYPYWADTVNVAPGERYSVLVQLDDPGVWVWHCHILTHVEREEGMFGMVTAFIVEES